MHPVEKPPAPSRRAYIVRERIVAPNQAAALQGAIWSGKTFAVAVAITCGHSILPKGFARSASGSAPGESLVTFALGEKTEVTFEPFGGETTDTTELMRRLGDEEWIKANPAHPLAAMYWVLRNYGALVKAIKNHLPLLMFQRGRSKAYVVVGGDVERNRFILERAKIPPAEIEQILALCGPEKSES